MPSPNLNELYVVQTAHRSDPSRVESILPSSHPLSWIGDSAEKIVLNNHEHEPRVGLVFNEKQSKLITQDSSLVATPVSEYLQQHGGTVWDHHFKSDPPKERIPDTFAFLAEEISSPDFEGLTFEQKVDHMVDTAKSKHNGIVDRGDAVVMLSRPQAHWVRDRKIWHHNLADVDGKSQADAIAKVLGEHPNHPGLIKHVAAMVPKLAAKGNDPAIHPVAKMLQVLGYLEGVYPDAHDKIRTGINFSRLGADDAEQLASRIFRAKEVFAKQAEASKETLQTLADTYDSKGPEAAMALASETVANLTSLQAQMLAHRASHASNQPENNEPTPAVERAALQRRA